MNKTVLYFFFLLVIIVFTGCDRNLVRKNTNSLRPLVDTIGFAHLGWQTDSIMNRIVRKFGNELNKPDQNSPGPWIAAICPHDDYTYTSWLYPAVLKNVRANTVIIFGVAHKAKQLSLEDKLVFDSFKAWHGPFGEVRVSVLRERIMEKLPSEFYTVSDSMQRIEQSVEALIPFLQYFNSQVTIVPILVPYMNYERMQQIGASLAYAISTAMKENQIKIGEDVALIITSDAVHYGDEEWGGKNYAHFGTDTAGTLKAVAFEHEILNNCFDGQLSEGRIKKFYDYTLNPDDYKEYKWTWCGRYSIPLGLITTLNLLRYSGYNPPKGQIVGYMNSIDHPELPVTDLRMGKTAIANPHHWVGYAAVGYR